MKHSTFNSALQSNGISIFFSYRKTIDHGTWLNNDQLSFAICWPHDFDALKLASQSCAVLTASWIAFSMSMDPSATLPSHSFRMSSNLSNSCSALVNSFVNLEALLTRTNVDSYKLNNVDNGQCWPARQLGLSFGGGGKEKKVLYVIWTVVFRLFFIPILITVVPRGMIVIWYRIKNIKNGYILKISYILPLYKKAWHLKKIFWGGHPLPVLRHWRRLLFSLTDLRWVQIRKWTNPLYRGNRSARIWIFSIGNNISSLSLRSVDWTWAAVAWRYQSAIKNTIWLYYIEHTSLS